MKFAPFLILVVGAYFSNAEVLEYTYPTVPKSKLESVKVQFNQNDENGNSCGTLKNLEISISSKKLLKDQFRSGTYYSYKACKFQFDEGMEFNPTNQPTTISLDKFKWVNEGSRATEDGQKCPLDFDNKNHLPYFKIKSRGNNFCLAFIELKTNSETFKNEMNRVTSRGTTFSYLPLFDAAQENQFSQAFDQLQCPSQRVCPKSNLVVTGIKSNPNGYYCDINPNCNGISSSNPEEPGNGLVCQRMEIGSIDLQEYCCTTPGSTLPQCSRTRGNQANRYSGNIGVYQVRDNERRYQTNAINYGGNQVNQGGYPYQANVQRTPSNNRVNNDGYDYQGGHQNGYNLG